jgi:hypothetical protein
MNVREGMRRLAVLLGVLGAILGACFAIAVPLNQSQRGEPLTVGDILGFASVPILGFLLPWGPFGLCRGSSLGFLSRINSSATAPTRS